MSTRLLKLFALALAVMLALTGCNLVVVDETMDDKTVVATFNGGTVTKGEMKDEYEYYVAMYAMYGYSGAETEVYLREYVTSYIAQDKILANKAAELGLDALSADEETQLAADSAADYEEYIQSAWDSYAEAGLTDEEIRADIEAYLSGNDVTYETVEAANREAIVLEHLKQYIYDGVSVTEAEIQDKYDAMVAADETSYADTAAFDNSVSTGGTTVAWYPEGYRTVKQILLMFTEEQRTVISGYDTQISAKQAELDELNALLSAGEAATTSEPAEGEAATDETTNATAESLQKEIDSINAARQLKIDEFVGLLQAKIDEIYARIEAGEDFDALMAEYGEDPGMQQEPGLSEGYYVSAGSTIWVAPFTAGAMALEKVGDVSEPVLTSYGLHIIRYESDVTPGAVPFATLHDTVSETVLSEKQTTAYNDAVAGWVTEADVKYDFSKY